MTEPAGYGPGNGGTQGCPLGWLPECGSCILATCVVQHICARVRMQLHGAQNPFLPICAFSLFLFLLPVQHSGRGASASLGPQFCSLFHCMLSSSCLIHGACPMGANSHHLSQCACLPGHLPTPVSHYSFQVGQAGNGARVHSSSRGAGRGAEEWIRGMDQ